MRLDREGQDRKKYGIKIVDLTVVYEKKRQDVTKDGFNYGVFDHSPPQAFNISCNKEGKDQEEALIKMVQLLLPLVFSCTGAQCY